MCSLELLNERTKMKCINCKESENKDGIIKHKPFCPDYKGTKVKKK